ncbi:MAG: helix-turn-helix domain-containing protein [Alphaproteobacteria bacterium]|nr:helix-turn-helix domain-containing protein [Alphaproteobacteria bacterium]
MPQGFYELLGLKPDATPAQVESAYQKELAALVRRMRHARQQGADISILEGQEAVLREARAVLGDAGRRRRYDAYRRASEVGVPTDLEGLWATAAEALVDPVAVAALRVVRTVTDLPVGEPFPGIASPAPKTPPPPPISMQPPAAPDRAGSELSVPRVALPPTASAPAVADTDPGMPAGLGGGASIQLAGLGTAPPLADTSPGIEVLAPSPTAYDPLEQLLGDLSGTDPGIRVQAAPSDPLDRLAKDYGYDGRFLAGVRELRGLTVDDLSRATRISTRYLQALEGNGYDQLPAATFVRGYLKEVVRVLELSDRDVVGGYMALFQRARG